MSYIVSAADVLTFLGLGATTDVITAIHDGVEAWVQNVYCRRTFVSTAYKEKYDGVGQEDLALKNYPIISLQRLSIGTDDAISIKNTNSSTHASVSVTSTGVSLYKDGVTTSVTFAANTTLTALVAAINALTGWSASLMASTYGPYLSTVLLEKFGLQCINSQEVYLPMPAEGEYDFEVEADKGIIHHPYSFGAGRRSVYVEYTAGYADADMPDDLQLAIKILIKNIYQKRSEEAFGANSYSVSGISVSFENDMPKEAKQVLSAYRRNIL